MALFVSKAPRVQRPTNEQISSYTMTSDQVHFRIRSIEAYFEVNNIFGATSSVDEYKAEISPLGRKYFEQMWHDGLIVVVNRLVAIADFDGARQILDYAQDAINKGSEHPRQSRHMLRIALKEFVEFCAIDLHIAQSEYKEAFDIINYNLERPDLKRPSFMAGIRAREAITLLRRGFASDRPLAMNVAKKALDVLESAEECKAMLVGLEGPGLISEFVRFDISACVQLLSHFSQKTGESPLFDETKDAAYSIIEQAIAGVTSTLLKKKRGDHGNGIPLADVVTRFPDHDIETFNGLLHLIHEMEKAFGEPVETGMRISFPTTELRQAYLEAFSYLQIIGERLGRESADEKALRGVNAEVLVAVIQRLQQAGVNVTFNVADQRVVHISNSVIVRSSIASGAPKEEAPQLPPPQA